ncbi:hypothetical protein BGZ74_007990 [Mortierella antarctica]|nr:hypothetical protein BGZ74_007990 [Mortierella antarctica]
MKSTNIVPFSTLCLMILRLGSAAPVPAPSMQEYGQHPQPATLSLRTLPLADTRGGLSAEDYIRSHSLPTNSEGFMAAPVVESDLVRGPALTKRGGLQEVDMSQMHNIVPAGHGNLDKHQELREEVVTTHPVAE